MSPALPGALPRLLLVDSVFVVAFVLFARSAAFSLDHRRRRIGAALRGFSRALPLPRLVRPPQLPLLLVLGPLAQVVPVHLELSLNYVFFPAVLCPARGVHCHLQRRLAQIRIQHPVLPTSGRRWALGVLPPPASVLTVQPRGRKCKDGHVGAVQLDADPPAGEVEVHGKKLGREECQSLRCRFAIAFFSLIFFPLLPLSPLRGGGLLGLSLCRFLRRSLLPRLCCFLLGFEP
mmetsp:Transcript_43107/g.131298  ORF Transcript_43107/g.131298 Transcript_43107/m.131298 type:complete len:233 (-) Transcript_43107:373-1071(-)